ncbi:MAG: sugar ABC transporter permease [Clostridia bacterium]|nr:sugar ABC transporter permease [Clostridia bacterium]
MKKTATTSETTPKKKKKYTGYFSDIKTNWQLYVLILIPLAYIIVFKYVPMYGARISFIDYKPRLGYMGSEWVGLKHFIRFINSSQFWPLIRNTLAISLYSLAINIPFPILLAVSLNYLKNERFKKTVQMVTYLPHFLSTVIIVSLIQLLFNTQSGIVNNVIQLVTGEKVNILGLSKYFRHLYVWSGVWQSTGWGSIMYISALAGVDPQLHEAAIIDGANKIRRIWHIDLAGILPTVAIMTIMNLGSIISVGFDKTFMMQNPTNLEISEVLSTYEYKIGIGGGIPSYSYPAAIGLMASVVSFLMIMTTNKISKKITEVGLW